MNLKKSQKFFYGCLSFLVGIALGEVMTISWWVILIVFVVGINLIFMFNHSRRNAPWRVPTAMVLFILLFVFGIFWNNLTIPKIDEHHISFYNEQLINFRAIINEEPDVRLDKQKLTVEPIDYKGKVLLSTYLYPEYEYGDLIEVNCNLKTPEQIEDFRYDKYLEKSGIYSVCYRPYIKVIEKNKGNLIIAKILDFKKNVETKINRTVAEPQAGLVAGILIGSRQGLPDYLKQQFNISGITHIIAISGYNITIIVVLIMNLGKALYVNRKKMIWGIMVGLIFFVILTGMSPSVVRAGIMGMIVVFAKQIGRKGNIRNILVFSAVLMTLVNPKILIWDAGFQLSFISTIGLIYLTTKLEMFLKWLPESLSIRENLASTMSAIIMTLPLILFQFHRLSIVAPIVNLVVLPVIPIAMLVGFLQFVFASINIFLGQVVGWFSWLLLGYVIKIVEIFSSFRFASIEFQISWWMMVVLYLLLFIFIVKRKTTHV